MRSRIEEGDPEFDLDWETAREIERDRAAGRFQMENRAKDGAEQDERPYVKFSVGRKDKAKESKSFLSDTAASAEVSTLTRRSVAPVLDSLTLVGSVANLPPKVKGMVDGICCHKVCFVTVLQQKDKNGCYVLTGFHPNARSYISDLKKNNPPLEASR